jgi:hypothetical protein
MTIVHYMIQNMNTGSDDGAAKLGIKPTEETTGLILRHAYRETRSSACEKASCKLPGIKAAKHPTYLHYKGSSISEGSLIMKIPGANKDTN